MVEQKSQKGVNGIIMKRKIYKQLLDLKEKRTVPECLKRSTSQKKQFFAKTFGTYQLFLYLCHEIH